MKKERNALKAGLFILVSIALILGILLSIQGLESFTQPTQTRQVVFDLSDNVGGLRVGDEVRIGGFKVGDVRSIDVENASAGAEDRPRIVVSYAIPRKFKVREDARIVVETTVTGVSVLNFKKLGEAGELPATTPLKGQSSAMEQIVTNLQELGPQIRATIDEVRTQTIPRVNQTVDKFGRTADSFTQTADKTTELAGHIRGKVDGVVEKYEHFVEVGVQMMAKVRDLFGDITGDFRSSIANVAAVTKTFKDKLPPLMEQMDQFLDKTTTTVESINQTMADVKATAENTKELTASARSVVVSNRSKFDEMIDSFKKTSDNLKYASEEIRRSPWRLLYKPRPGEVANLNVFDAARQFAEGANDLNDASAALRDALKDRNADQDQIRKLMDRVDQSFDHFKGVEQKLWTSVKE